MNSRVIGCLVLAVLVSGVVADGADTEVAADTDKPADTKKTVKPGKTFKPVMISRTTRNAIYPHRHDIEYADGGWSHVIHFPRPVRRPDNRVEAMVGRPRVWGWNIPRPKEYVEPLYHDEYDFINRIPRMILPRSLFRRVRRSRSSQRPSAWEQHGLPSFPPMPRSVQRPPRRTRTQQQQYSGVRVHSEGRRNSYGVIEYPTYGMGPRANLQKLDFALERLSTLNRRLREAESRVAAARSASKRVDRQIAALTRIRSNIKKMASQIASLEAKLGRDRSMQKEIASIAPFDPSTGIPSLGSDNLGEWLGDVIRY